MNTAVQFLINTEPCCVDFAINGDQLHPALLRLSVLSGMVYTIRRDPPGHLPVYSSVAKTLCGKLPSAISV